MREVFQVKGGHGHIFTFKAFIHVHCLEFCLVVKPLVRMATSHVGVTGLGPDSVPASGNAFLGRQQLGPYHPHMRPGETL